MYKRQILVQFGLLNKNTVAEFGIEQDVYGIDFNWEAVLGAIKNKNLKFKPISKFPIVKRDFALLIDDEVTFESIYKIAKQTDQKILKDICLFDVYKGGKLAKGKKSYAVSFTLRDETKTLTEKDIDKTMSKLQKRLEKELGAELR